LTTLLLLGRCGPGRRPPAGCSRRYRAISSECDRRSLAGKRARIDDGSSRTVGIDLDSFRIAAVSLASLSLGYSIRSTVSLAIVGGYFAQKDTWNKTLHCQRFLKDAVPCPTFAKCFSEAEVRGSLLFGLS